MSFSLLLSVLLLLEDAVVDEPPIMTLDGASDIGGCWLCLLDSESRACLLSSSIAESAFMSLPKNDMIRIQFFAAIAGLWDEYVILSGDIACSRESPLISRELASISLRDNSNHISCSHEFRVSVSLFPCGCSSSLLEPQAPLCSELACNNWNFFTSSTIITAAATWVLVDASPTGSPVLQSFDSSPQICKFVSVVSNFSCRDFDSADIEQWKHLYSLQDDTSNQAFKYLRYDQPIRITVLMLQSVKNSSKSSHDGRPDG